MGNSAINSTQGVDNSCRRRRGDFGNARSERAGSKLFASFGADDQDRRQNAVTHVRELFRHWRLGRAMGRARK